MFGARVVRQKRERERQDRLARDLDGPVIPYIKPFGERFEPSELPYFKYRSESVSQSYESHFTRTALISNLFCGCSPLE